MTGRTHVGRETARIEDARLVTGQARWTDSIHAPDALFLGVVRSPIAHAVLGRVDVSEAAALPDVVAAFTAADLADAWHKPLPANPAGQDAYVPDHWPLATDRVRHVGEPVAVVAATSRAAAEDALEAVDVDYDPLPGVPDPEAALVADALVHDEAAGNVAFRHRGTEHGDVDALFAEADVVLERRYVLPRLVPAPMETRAALATPEPDGGLTLHTSTQVPHSVRARVAKILGLDRAKVRVVAPDVGGAFGAKLNPYPEDLLCAAVALRLGRPVRWTGTRSEDFQTTNHARGQVQDIAVAAKADGTLLALRVHITADCGAYLMAGSVVVPMSGRRMFPGCYRWQGYRFDATGVFTTAVPTDAYRGAGRPEAAYGVERIVDDLAAELGMDPAELRRRNFPDASEFPYSTVGGYEYDSGDYAAALDLALEKVDYPAVRAEQAERRERGDRVQVGVGLSSYVEVCGFGPGVTETGGVRIGDDGAVEVSTGLSPHGQGTATSLAQIAADALGVEPADITVLHSDTAVVPEGTGTFGSRSMAVGGPAVRAAAGEVADRARLIAAHLLEAAPEDIEITPGRLGVRGSPTVGVTLADVSSAVARGDVPEGVDGDLAASTSYEPDGLTFPFGTHACVVEVDTETGWVEIRRFVAVDDVGNVINPQLLDGQRHGGLAQGIAQALYEGVIYDADGNLQTSTFVDYFAPTAPDLPAYELRRTTTPSPHNPLGVKGAGEAGAIGAPPAVVNAVLDALRHLGVTNVDMPCTPQRVWQALRADRTVSPASRKPRRR